MKICIIHPNACSESARELADAIGADVSNPFQEGRRNYNQYDLVFNYGCNRRIYAHKVINQQEVIAVCTDKRETFKVFKKDGIPHPGFALNYKDTINKWAIIVARKTASGCKNEGMEYYHNVDVENMPKDCELYTEFFPHKYEYRIVVFNGKVVGRYHKKLVGEEWHLEKMLKQGFEEIDASCIKAAKALGIDYVGFDVLENKKGIYVVLEANSGPIIMEEAVKAIKKYVKGLK